MNKDARTKAAANRSNASKGKKSPASSHSRDASARRTWIVLAGLCGALAGAGALLKALAPPPLTPDATASLFAVGEEQSIEQIFDTPAPVRAGRWRSIYVHQSLTHSGNAFSLAQDQGGMADHFLIGNGNPLPDGAVQTGQRWSQQLAAGAVPGVEVSSDCISICVVGNFNRSQPSLTQQARLVDLISALQRQLAIPSDHVVIGVDAARGDVAGVGMRFPAQTILAQLTQ